MRACVLVSALLHSIVLIVAVLVVVAIVVISSFFFSSLASAQRCLFFSNPPCRGAQVPGEEQSVGALIRSVSGEPWAG